MREIKFRGKDYKTGKWIYGNLIQSDLNHPQTFISTFYPCASSLTCQQLTANLMVMIDIKTVGQFTGLYDSTKWEQLSEQEQSEWISNRKKPSDWIGREIYEGDILSFDGNITADDSLGIEPNGYVYDEDSIHLVVWDNEIGGWSLAFEKNAEWKYKHHTHGLMTGGIAIVIGNIYDNPELLKVNQ